MRPVVWRKKRKKTTHCNSRALFTRKRRLKTGDIVCFFDFRRKRNIETDKVRTAGSSLGTSDVTSKLGCGTKVSTLCLLLGETHFTSNITSEIWIKQKKWTSVSYSVKRTLLRQFEKRHFADFKKATNIVCVFFQKCHQRIASMWMFLRNTKTINKQGDRYPSNWILPGKEIWF